jgi:hypothetical protein
MAAEITLSPFLKNEGMNERQAGGLLLRRGFGLLADMEARFVLIAHRSGYNGHDQREHA